MADRHELPELSHEELLRYSRHLLLPEVGRRGPAQAQGRPRAAHRRGRAGSPLALYLAAAGIGTLGLVDFDVRRPHQPPAADPPRHRRRRAAQAATPPRAAHAISTPTWRWTATTSAHLAKRARHHPASTTSSSTAPTTSRRATWSTTPACCSGKPNVYGSIFRFEGQASVFATPAGPATAASIPSRRRRARAQLRRGRRARRAARDHRHHPGDRDDQADPRSRRTAVGPAAALRRAAIALPRASSSARIPSARSAATTRRSRADRLRGLLRDRAGPAGDVPRSAPRSCAPSSAGGRVMTLVDVREPHEWAASRIEGATLIPLGELPARLAELDARLPVVAYCQRGTRSRRAAEILRAAGFSDVRSLAGGIERWEE